MPNDVYRWEEGGGLVHHCPICKTPLSHDVCRSQCLVHHVEWCTRYHTQLFRKGLASQCAPCKHSEGQHDKRHREIAELVHQVKGLRDVEPTQEATTPRGNRTHTGEFVSPLPKKERKAAKRAARLASLPKVITTADIDAVAKALHPDSHGEDEAEEERRLLEDPDIKLNLYYHKGTSNNKETRHRHIKRKQKSGDQSMIDGEEVNAMLADLKVPSMSQVKTAEERRLVEAIRTAVQEDLVNVAKEQDQTQMRKAGFWRWASRKVYQRLLQSGRLSAADAAGTPKRKDSAVAEGEEEEAEDVATELARLGVGEDGDGSADQENAAALMVSTPMSEDRR
ncbi:hypothetical protein LTR53_005506, partial [Teratosphaeriaceae sp. CCFEE 6253]